MEKVKTSLRRLIYRAKHDWFHFDNVLLFVCIGLCLYWTYGSITAMSRNWQLSESLADKNYELARLELEVDTMELENSYYASSEYQELSARAKFNKAFEGETMLYLPANSDYAKSKHNEVIEITTRPERSNLAKWLSFLFGI